jgi:hypothetical protein
MNLGQNTRKAVSALAFFLTAIGAAQAQTSVQLSVSSLGNGLYSNGLTLPVQRGVANYWSGLQTIDVIKGASKQSFLAFCIDPFQWASRFSSSYTMSSSTTNIDEKFGTERANNIRALFNEGYNNALSSKSGAAAMQLALWEVANDDMVLSTGGVRTSAATNRELVSGAQSLLTNLGSYRGPSLYSYTLYTSSSKQDFLVAAPVPEPETYAMMLAGLGLLGMVARCRKQKLNT